MNTSFLASNCVPEAAWPSGHPLRRNRHALGNCYLLGAAFVFAAIPATSLADDGQATAELDVLGAKVSSQTLDLQRGGEMTVNTIDEHADLKDNNAIDNVTGSNFITEHAFSGASGFRWRSKTRATTSLFKTRSS